MQKVVFEMKTITPLFLAGADQEKAELRAPSFRGLMRYWQRALVGGIVGGDTKGLAEVVKAETATFGTTDTASAVLIRVSNASAQPKELTERLNVQVNGQWQSTGKGYLIWSMSSSGRKERGNYKPARRYFPLDTRFQITLASRSNDDKLFQQAIAAFWLLTRLGGVGSRSRRCAGSLTVQRVEGDTAGFSFQMPANAQALKKQLEEGINAARALYNKLTPHPTEEAQFDVLAKGVCRIWILQDEQPWVSAELAMQAIGERLQDYRRDIPSTRRKVFGLPLPPMIFNKRHASPLLLRVVELQGNKYVGIAVLFKTAWKEVPMNDYGVIEAWINKFRGKVEVML